ncbi:MAG: hypothetical protein JSS27_16480 [Planctomycetes bacterium]|nr:hypothetical protein [Planctomycetota bacterium]
MNINFFAWIREGVRQAVLHGVNDAVGHMGHSTHDPEMSQRVLQAIQQTQAIPATATATVATGGASANRRRKLGRSLDQIVNDRNENQSKR